jgi:hypothetical protein
MAKGDAERARNEAEYQKTRYEGQIDPVLQTAGNAYDKAVPQAQNDYNTIMGKYKGFSENGGFNPEDISAFRARATSPVRAAYSAAEQGVGRQRALQGGYSPNATATMAKMARERSQAGSDAMTGANASIAQLVQQGRMGGVQGMQSMYGTTPGMASTFGNQVLNATGQSSQFGNQQVGNRINIGQMPSDFDIGLGRLGKIGGLAQGVLGGI